jgi:hypothetical protein
MVLNIKGIIYKAEKLDPSELVSFKELLMANSMQVDAIAQLLIEKGFFYKGGIFRQAEAGTKPVSKQYR